MVRHLRSETVSMRRARRWLSEEQAEATRLGHVLPEQMVRLYEHIAGCFDCHLREHNDPDLCEVAEDIMAGEDDDEMTVAADACPGAGPGSRG